MRASGKEECRGNGNGNMEKWVGGRAVLHGGIHPNAWRPAPARWERW